jgi:hypothetical protein
VITSLVPSLIDGDPVTHSYLEETPWESSTEKIAGGGMIPRRGYPRDRTGGIAGGYSCIFSRKNNPFFPPGKPV